MEDLTMEIPCVSIPVPPMRPTEHTPAPWVRNDDKLTRPNLPAIEIDHDPEQTCCAY